MSAAAWIAGPVLLLAGAGAAWLLRSSWRDRQHKRAERVLAGWAVVLAGAWGAGAMMGPMPGLFASFALIPLGVLAVVAQGATWHRPRPLRAKPLRANPLHEPVAREAQETRAPAWKGWIKGLLAGPLGMTAAMGMAFCYAVWMPGAVQTRLLVAALLVPALWGLAMTWTLADRRLLRSTAVLAGASTLGFGLAFLKGIS